MSAASDETINAIVAALRAEYAPELPPIVRRLRGAIERARSSPGDAKALRPAIDGAHQLHGTAGSYEFLDVSEAASRIEDALLPFASSGAVPESAWERVEQALAALERAVAAPLFNPPRAGG